jgi:hypothetical protein
MYLNLDSPRTNFAGSATATASPTKPLFGAGRRESFPELSYQNFYRLLNGKIYTGQAPSKPHLFR